MKQNTKKVQEETIVQEQVGHLTQDLKNSVLIVSVVINLFFLSLWIALQATTKFDSSLASFFLGR